MASISLAMAMAIAKKYKTDGREIELIKADGVIKWRYKGQEDGEGWQVLVSLDELKGEKGDDGEQGIQGKDGYTPVKGVDYFTQEDKEELILEIFNRVTDGNEVAY